jgi:hypothetical protein
MNFNLFLIEGLRLLTALVCFFIAGHLGSRKLTDEDDRWAWTAFRVWWWGLGATTLISLLNAVLPVFGMSNLAVYVALAQLNILVICVALWGLLFYLVYLYTGKRNLAVPIAIFYLIVFVFLVAYVFTLQPVGFAVEDGRAVVQYANEVSPAYTLALTLILLLPQLLASLGYFSFFFRVRERAQKYRVLLVSISVFVWFGSPLLASLLSLSNLSWWPLASRLITLLAAIAIYWAYYPPQFIQSRLRVQSI